MERKKLKEIGIDIGLLFQIVDDLIDYKEDSEIVRNPKKKYREKSKATLINLIGYKKTVNFAKKFKNEINEKIKKYGAKANDLLESIEFILSRKI